jgi:serine/threonine-protein kinase RsbW
VDADVVATVPARPEYVLVLRAVARAVAARFDFTYDRIEDLHLVVDEACAALLSVPAEATSLTMLLSPGDRSVAVYVSSDAEVDAQEWPPPQMEKSLAWRVLSGLADEATFELTADGPLVRVAFKGIA